MPTNITRIDVSSSDGRVLKSLSTSVDIQRVLDRSDFYAQQRGSTYYQPELTMEEAAELGFTMVWSDGTWILWKVPEPGSDEDR